MKIKRSAHPALFFSEKEKKKIVEAIQIAEKQTSGEIRVHLERKAKPDILIHAQEEFNRLGMGQTQLRNGVLILFGVHSKRFAIWAGQGIHEKVPEDFWASIAARMAEQFKQDQFAEGVTLGIQAIGEKLKLFFPYEPKDTNELPDEISYSL